MATLEEWMRSLRETDRSRRRPPDPLRPASMWREQELLDGEVVDAVTAILSFGGCSHDRLHGGCTMCGYSNDSPDEAPTEEQLLGQINEVANSLEGARWVKLYTSGSMLDPDEVPPNLLDEIADAFGQLDMVTVESRAEHVTADRVRRLAKALNLEVAIGLESACEAVLDRSVHKGMALEEFQRGVAGALEGGAAVRAYVLLKPPFLTEAEAIDDAVEAATFAVSSGAATVSVNPVNVQFSTLVDHLHHRGEYEPPWLWSVVEVLRRAEEALGGKARVLSAPTGGGTPRGAHNCGECDRFVMASIKRHLLGGGVEQLEVAPGCACIGRWRAQLALEGLEQGPFAPHGYRRR
jgi:radical SAM enzyme (TIGR01210 family)